MTMKHFFFAILLLGLLVAYSEDNAVASVLDRQWVALGEKGKLEY
jgi:hypothetical protein